MQGAKDDNGKLRYDLIPPEIETELARIFTYGAEKYSPRNCEKGFRYGRLYAAARRHMSAFWNGEEDDPESELLHLSHALWNIGMLIVQNLRGTGEDDRVKMNGPQGEVDIDEGCGTCKHFESKSHKKPCTQCRHNFTLKWEAADD